ncbi:MAG: methionine adenosyltransferase [Acholeplasmatales bacterium]|nr:methionine adenosyltransferase [Acholeplasmatales bacterium]
MIKYFSSESVTKGHPDKVCDLIADKILDAILQQDPLSRVAVEASVISHFCHIFGEVTTKASVDYEAIVRETIKNIGYTKAEYGFDYQSVEVLVNLTTQSSDIALGVDKEGAGDQGIMFGYACDETAQYMPLAISYAHDLAYRLALVRQEGILPYLRPDGKTQVTIKYDGEKVLGVSAVVVSAQHDPNISHEQIYQDLMREVIVPVVGKSLLPETKFYINPTGSFVIGGPAGDSGLTGRKNIVDTYGGYARHGGGSFSGKDATKVDRSATYMARYLAKNIVAAGLCRKCEIEISYAIGVIEPLSVYLDTFNTGVVSDKKILDYLRSHISLAPSNIIKTLGLRRPFFSKTTNYGHFGKSDPDFWYERLDLVEGFKTLLKGV